MTVLPTVLVPEASSMPQKSTLSETLEPGPWRPTHRTTLLRLGLGHWSTAGRLFLWGGHLPGALSCGRRLT